VDFTPSLFTPRCCGFHAQFVYRTVLWLSHPVCLPYSFVAFTPSLFTYSVVAFTPSLFTVQCCGFHTQFVYPTVLWLSHPVCLPYSIVAFTPSLFTLQFCGFHTQFHSTILRYLPYLNFTQTADELHGPGIKSQWGRDFLRPSRPALQPTQPPIQWVPGLYEGK